VTEKLLHRRYVIAILPCLVQRAPRLVCLPQGGGDSGSVLCVLMLLARLPAMDGRGEVIFGAPTLRMRVSPYSQCSQYTQGTSRHVRRR